MNILTEIVSDAMAIEEHGQGGAVLHGDGWSVDAEDVEGEWWSAVLRRA